MTDDAVQAAAATIEGALDAWVRLSVGDNSYGAREALAGLVAKVEDDLEAERDRLRAALKWALDTDFHEHHVSSCPCISCHDAREALSNPTATTEAIDE